MQITETLNEGLKKHYKIIVSASDMSQTMEQELKAVGQKVKIPGFRPGHVPMKVLKDRYSKNVESDVIKSVVNDATRKAIEDNKLRLAIQPDVKVEEYKEDGDLIFTLKLETLPELPELKYTDITLERETFEVADSEIETALKSMAEHSPTVAPLAKDAKAEDGHVLTVDFVGKANGEVFEGGSAEDFTIEIGSGRLIGDFEQQLIGLKAGDEKLVKVTFPENYFNKELAGQPATFDVTIKQVAKNEPSKIDDEFAKERKFADLASLKEAVREQIVKDYDELVRGKVKKRLFDELEGKCKYDLPPSMVEMEFNSIWGRLMQTKEQQKDVDVFEGRDEEEVRKEYEDIAARRVRLGLLLADIGSKHKLQVDKEELTQALMQQASQFPGQEQAIFDFYRKNPDRLDELRGPILEEKAVDWILAQVKTTDKPTTTEELRKSAEEDEEGENAKKPAKKKSKASEEKSDTKTTAKKAPAKKPATKKKSGE